MKILIVVSALIAVGYSKSLDFNGTEGIGYAYSYRIGIPLAKKIYEAENEMMKSQRIVGGENSFLGQFPYQAGLVISYSNIPSLGVCGASLVTSTRLITAAHCWIDGFNSASNFTVVLGSLTVFYGGTRIVTNQVAAHPTWNPLLVINDVAVIYLPTSVTFTNLISPIALPSGSEMFRDYVGEATVASGYGLTHDGAGLTPDQHLKHVNLRVITNEECASIFGDYIVRDSSLCTRGVLGDNICFSDSGGPLAVVSNNRNLLIGVTHFVSSIGCEQYFPGGFARVTYYMDFFSQHIP